MSIVTVVQQALSLFDLTLCQGAAPCSLGNPGLLTLQSPTRQTGGSLPPGDEPAQFSL